MRVRSEGEGVRSEGVNIEGRGLAQYQHTYPYPLTSTHL